MGELAKIENYCELSKTNLVFKRDINEAEWMDVFQSLKMVEGCVQFWIGDCLAYRQQKWGMYDDIAEETGYDKQTLKNLKSVSENVPSTVRLSELSFTHHAEVASLAPEKQELFLNRASEEKLSVRDLRQEIKNDNKKDFIIKELPVGVFNLIYCDPPWQYDFSETDSRKIENQYPTMSVDEICEMQLPNISDNCLLLMWATSPKLLEALKVIKSWGFEYKTHGIWDKGKIGMGYWFRGQHELLLIATKGNFSPPDPLNRNSSIYKEDRKTHSKKPEFYYEWIEKSFPDTNKIELFQRGNRENWEGWGNE